MAFKIRPIEDFNEVTHHMAEVMYAHLAVTKSPPIVRGCGQWMMCNMLSLTQCLFHFSCPLIPSLSLLSSSLSPSPPSPPLLSLSLPPSFLLSLSSLPPPSLPPSLLPSLPLPLPLPPFLPPSLQPPQYQQQAEQKRLQHQGGGGGGGWGSPMATSTQAGGYGGGGYGGGYGGGRQADNGLNRLQQQVRRIGVLVSLVLRGARGTHFETCPPSPLEDQEISTYFQQLLLSPSLLPSLSSLPPPLPPPQVLSAISSCIDDQGVNISQVISNVGSHGHPPKAIRY